jgi:hypothetical protein
MRYSYERGLHLMESKSTGSTKLLSSSVVVLKEP